jgi:hypothetical protein
MFILTVTENKKEGVLLLQFFCMVLDVLHITVYGYGAVGNVGSNVSSPACRSASTTTLSCTHRRICVPSNSASTTIPSVLHSLGSVI